MITRFLKNRIAYLSTSFCLFVAAMPLISIGTTTGPAIVWHAGFICLILGALIPPGQRLLFPPKPQPKG